MKTSRKFILALITGAAPIMGIAIGLIVYWRIQSRLPHEIESILDRAESLELLSIDPTFLNLKEQPPGVEVFHHYRVLGKTTIVDGTAKRDLIAALNRSIAESLGRGMKCFNPRHAIRAVYNGQTADLLICFQCENLEIHLNGTQLPMKEISRAEQPVFDHVLTGANIALASRDY